jgi:undecaprenyl-diphosphatase
VRAERPRPPERPTLYRRWLSPEGYLGLHLAVGFVLALIAGWAFAEVADRVVGVEGGHAADTWAWGLVQALHTPAMNRVMRFFTLLGKAWVLTVLSVAVAAWLLWVRSHRRLYAFLAIMAGGSLLNALLKLYFARERPAWRLVPPPDSYSFPSGHAMGSLLFFGSLAYVLYFTLTTHRAGRVAAAAGCLVVALLIGLSRVYLGVHYLTDVAAGFFAALCWMGVCVSGVEAWVRWRDWRRRRRGRRVAAAVGVLLAAGALPARAASDPPCAACVVWEVDPGTARTVLAQEEDLAGVRLLLLEDEPSDLPARLRARGADVAVALAAPIRDDAALFRLKQAVTGWRARQPGLRVGLVGPAWPPLDPYLDFVVGEADWRRRGGMGSLPLAEVLRAAGSAAQVVTEWRGPEVARRVAGLRAVLPAGLLPWGDAPVACDGCAVETFLHPADGSLAVLVRGPEGGPVPQVSGAVRAWHDLGGGTVAIHLERPAETFVSSVDASAARALTVDEVVARHQAAAARQRALVHRVIAEGSSVVAFQAPGLAAPLTITASSTLFSGDGLLEVEHRAIRLNGLAAVAVDGDGVPRLPIVEPERARQTPLAIALDESYAYRLEGREAEGGRDCYVVAFAPRGASARPLFRGRAWIESAGFGLVRLQAAQTNLRGVIAAADQDDRFTPVDVAGETVWLLARSEAHQAYEGPGHRTPIHRVMAWDRHEVNPDDYDRRRARAHASAEVLTRETEEGLRYLRRDPRATAAAPLPRTPAPPATRVRAVAAGVVVDPNVTRPMPFAGFSYVDFDFLRTGGQVSAFLAPAFAQASWSVPRLFGSAWQLQGYAFGTLAEYNARSFRGGVERYEENLRQRPARLSVGAVRPLRGGMVLRADYELSYTRLREAESTAPDFVLPPSPVVHALRLTAEAQRGGWTASAWWSPARRQRWGEWGRPGAEDGEASSSAAFQRYGVGLARSLVFSTAAVGRVEAAWMGGRALDRFSRYTFDAFENRLRGYPTASVRFDRGGVARATMAWSATRRVRLDAFADAAFVDDPGLGDGLRAYPGLGAGVEAPLPHLGIVAAEWGYGFEGRRVDGGRGTHVFRVTAYRVF